MRCAGCGTENPDRARFCFECAQPFARRCSHCGAELLDAAKFCMECAQPVAGVGPPPARSRTTDVHAAPPGREDPGEPPHPRRGAEAGHDPVRRRRGLDGADPGPRSRGGAGAAGRGRSVDDGGRPPVRGDGQPADGRRPDGDVRGARGPRGPRRPSVLRGAGDAGGGPRLRRRGPRRGTGCPPRHGSGSAPARWWSGRSATTCTWITRRWARRCTWPRGWSSSRGPARA